MDVMPPTHEQGTALVRARGGISGAGKSTFTQNRATLRVLLEARGPETEVINPDLITRDILSSEPQLSG